MNKEDTELSSKLITNGEVQTFFKKYQQYYSISGIIVQGNQIGRKIGFPTANIDIKKLEHIPKIGVYAVFVAFENRLLHGMLNIGIRPTFNYTDLTVEVHLLNFEQTIYNAAITVFFVSRIRDEQKFTSKELLVQQLENDRSTIAVILDKAPLPILS
jgi:riboflavin kinase/FMN adenylyltransferase